MSFPCTGCGLCCRAAGVTVMVSRSEVASGNLDPLIVETAAFPYEFDADGKCENLLDDNSCAVYETRPDICNVARTYEKHYASNQTRQEVYEETAQVCNEMMDYHNIDQRLRVKMNHE